MSQNPVIQAITEDDFKAQFFRDFTFINTWLVTITYATGNQVFFDVEKRFYESLTNGNIGNLPTDDTKWKQIPSNKLISDLDINNAFAEACVTFNEALFTNDDNLKLGFLYLSAHYLVHDLNANGLSGAGQIGIVSSRSVGSVSEGFSIPQAFLDKPIYSFYVRSTYGIKYLNMVLPRLAGNVVSIEGATIA